MSMTLEAIPLTVKSQVSERLARMEVMEGMLPTRAERSDALSSVAHSLRQGNAQAALRATEEHLAHLTADPRAQAATQMFSGSLALREQTAGYADAGILFFHASSEFWRLNPSQRTARGGNGAVSRVLVSGQRILLETPRVIVRFEEGTKSDRDAVLARHNLIEIPTGGLPPDTVRAALVRGEALEQSQALMQEPGVAFAEPDFIEHVGQRYTPNDPEFSNQWHHANIQAEEAWDSTKGEGVSIAVIDNGFYSKHPDLVFGGLSGWFRPTPDHVDADFVPGTIGMADGNHGTACAGMAGARSGNGSGGCGVAFKSATSMIACFGDQIGTQSTLARAIAFAARPSLEETMAETGAGADIIVCSLGPNSASWSIRQVLSDAIDFAATEGRDGKGCAVFWACTNGNFPIGSDEVASHQHVIAVGRSRQDDHDDGCGFGPQLEFLAPGVSVRIPASGGGYQVTTGTSFAAPCAAGIAALALSQRTSLTTEELRQVMRDSCDKTGDLPYIQGRNVRFGHGRINAAKAVAGAQAFVPGV